MFDLLKVTVQGIQFGAVSNVISAMQARRLMRKSCEAFLALVLDSKRSQVCNTQNYTLTIL